MNTLPKTITQQFFKTPDGYEQCKAIWKHNLGPQGQKLTVTHHMLYAILRGKDWRKGFTPMTNKNKLANGNFEAWAFFDAVWMLEAKHWEKETYAPFKEILADDAIEKIRALLPLNRRYSHKPETYTNGIPFEAYDDTAAQALSMVPETAGATNG